jgi:signal transduction histidine kinase/CheY-like chemotaxis protein
MADLRSALTFADLLPASLQPLKRKLPLLITVLLCVVVGAFSWMAHRRLMLAFETAEGRDLTVAARQVEWLLDQSMTAARRETHRLASEPAVVEYLGLQRSDRADSVVRLLSGPTSVPRAAPGPIRTLWTRECRALLSVRDGTPDSSRVACPSASERTTNQSRVAWIRPFSLRGDSVQFELVAPVVRGADTVGFLTERGDVKGGAGLNALKEIVGAHSRMFVGNAVGGTLWTDFARLRHVAPVPKRGLSVIVGRADKVRRLSIDVPIHDTPWLLWMDLPLAPALADEGRAMQDLAILALLCVVLGAVGAWYISAHITRPLVELTKAADEVARGHYGRRVPTARQDEIGHLMSSFDHMAAEVEYTQGTLRVQTQELQHHFLEAQELARDLEIANQELLESIDAADAARRDSTVAESLLDEMMTRAPVGIAVFDRDLRFVRLNPAIAAFDGVPQRAHYGRRLTEVMPRLIDAQTRIRYVLETGETIVAHRSSAILHGTTRSHWLSSYFPVRGADEEITGVGIIVVDTTAQHDLQMQFLQAQKMEAVGRLAGGVAHDFNNILTVILSYASMAVEALAAEDPLHADISEIVSAGQRAIGLTRQLLAFSRKQVLQPSIVDLNDVAREMQRMLSRLIGEDVTLTLNLAADACRVNADRGQIEQVLMNLAINARDAMPDGGRLTITTAHAWQTAEHSIFQDVTPTSEWVLLSVNDTGTGMSEEVQSHLFEPFFTTKPVGKGTGLGLATVYGIVQQSSAEIHVQSAMAEGTTFTIRLPCARAAVGAAAATAAMRDAHFGGHETLLLVEDDDSLRHLALRVLRRTGYTVLEASNAEAALRLASTHVGPIDLLLTDVVMPGMNGRALGELLAAQLPTLRVLYMSGYTDDDVLRRGVSSAHTAFLLKPFTPVSLGVAVRAALSMAVIDPDDSPVPEAA